MSKVSIVIPTIGKDRDIIDLLQQITEQADDVVRDVYVFDNGMPENTRKDCAIFPDIKLIPAIGMGIYKMWNWGVVKSLRYNPTDYVAILNDDLTLMTDNFFTKLIEPLDLHGDVYAVCGNYCARGLDPRFSPFEHDPDDYMLEVSGTYKDHGFAGFCFAVKGEAYLNGLPPFEEGYHWWYGDDDFVHCIHAMGKKTVVSLNAHLHHIDGGSQTVVQYTPEFNEKVAKDGELYRKKWHNG